MKPTRRRKNLRKDDTNDTFFIDSVSALKDFIKFKPESIIKITCTQKYFDKIQNIVGSYIQLVKVISESDCKNLGCKPFEAQVKIEPIGEKQLLEKTAQRTKDIVLVLDHITDPRNLGAIARSAAYFGVKEIVVAKNRQVLLTGASVHTSQGAFSLTELVQVTNLSRVVSKLKKEGYWIIGCERGGDEIEKVNSLYEKVVLVLGSEDKGLSPLMRENCDLFVGIDGAAFCLGSLNVSVACGIILRAFQLEQKNKI